MQVWRPAWYLLRCRENTWKTTLQNLTEAGLKTCCPILLERRRRRDKKNAYRLINSPAFPGYIFVKFNPAQIHTTAIKQMPGAMDFVRFGNRVATLNQDEIEALKIVQHHPSLGTVRMESTHLSDEFLKRAEKIFNSEESAVRIDLLFSYLWSKNVNQIYQARKEK
ncbi:transcription termination/antitermination NusG family protein [Xenorhabdus sp. SGI246]|uniref:transcription termination/antitermination NusG family protein n=1 Tax=Xenorhabdus sp. SGI246 TaxID=3158263 RepID=UPI00349FC8CC